MDTTSNCASGVPGFPPRRRNNGLAGTVLTFARFLRYGACCSSEGGEKELSVWGGAMNEVESMKAADPRSSLTCTCCRREGFRAESGPTLGGSGLIRTALDPNRSWRFRDSAGELFLPRPLSPDKSTHPGFCNPLPGGLGAFFLATKLNTRCFATRFSGGSGRFLAKEPDRREGILARAFPGALFAQKQSSNTGGYPVIKAAKQGPRCKWGMPGGVLLNRRNPQRCDKVCVSNLALGAP